MFTEFLIEAKGMPPKPKAGEITAGMEFVFFIIKDRFDISITNVQKPRKSDVKDIEIKISYKIKINSVPVSRPMIESFESFIRTWWG